jgi:ribonuclease J
MGYPDHRIFTMVDGVPLVLDDTAAHQGEKVPCGRVLVDNSGQPGVTDEVLRDRYNVANDGLVVVTLAIDTTAGEVVGDPIIQTRGFHGPEGILDVAFDHLVDALRSLSKDELRDISRVKHDSGDVVKRLIQKRTQLRPLVLPVIVEV